jgi:hypothetical protein
LEAAEAEELGQRVGDDYVREFGRRGTTERAVRGLRTEGCVHLVHEQTRAPVCDHASHVGKFVTVGAATAGVVAIRYRDEFGVFDHRGVYAVGVEWVALLCGPSESVHGRAQSLGGRQ